MLDAVDLHCSVRRPDGGELVILRGLTLVVGQGEIVSIVGRSGSGKSTLLHVLGLLDQPTSGTYRVRGQPVGSLSSGRRAQLRGQLFGFVFQQFCLLDRRTAVDNVAEPTLFGTDRRHRRLRAEKLLDLVGLGDRLWSMPHQLSGGEQQRVALARALVGRPKVVLADEPTGALDDVTAALVLDLLVSLAKQQGITLIFVTHDPVISARADRRLALVDGELAELPP